MTRTEREREAMQWAGRGMHLINHLALSLPSLHILLESLPLMWLRDILQSQRVAGAWALSCYYWKRTLARASFALFVPPGSARAKPSDWQGSCGPAAEPRFLQEPITGP